MGDRAYAWGQAIPGQTRSSAVFWFVRKIIAEGYYKFAPHAEADALKKLENSLRHELMNENGKEDGLTMYVTLEPHNFQGNAAVQTQLFSRG